ncbi:MAG: class I tRNA ligase family protein [Patescibacteria group bacterium]|nr:class I tRNA ligase family protein [Patescibacteria group bacterium]MDE2015429.1 class I tRNA ligase family protein [Patescibacteria group bacterium]MDE2226956.1 class I tRNA ligase family protein [Patescibacteria group bacterium]
MPKYDSQKVEKKWQKKWLEEKVYEPDLKNPKKPFYNLMMFPYPSAEGLHVGNMYAFTGSDIYGRYQRMRGNDVFEPIGLDGFGIHSENYALKVGTHPMEQAKVSEKRFYEQLQAIGNGFAWDEHLETYDPEYYKWTQWIFTQMWKRGLAYRKKQRVNWCPKDKTVLADEQVEGGKCERCGSVVEKRELEQWFFRITAYAEKLLQNIEKLDWSEKVKIAQRNWIGRSEGALLKFPVMGSKLSIEVFTTRPDTLFGATYMVLAPEHALVLELKEKISNWKDVEKYIESSKKKTEDERIAEGKEKTGVELKGVKAINPANKEEIPIWLADYVLSGYGTGAIMAVPAQDERDSEFAKKFKLPIRTVIEPITGEPRTDESERAGIVAIVEDPKTGKILSLDWRDGGGVLFVGGGIESGEDLIRCGVREIIEETGYKNLKFISSTETIHHHFHAFSKNKNRYMHAIGLYFQLENEEREKERLEDHEKDKFIVGWITKDEAESKVKDAMHQYIFQKLIRGKCYSGPGLLANSGKFSGMDSEKAKWEITKFVGGEKKIQYRLRDWLISRQRYWGPPIPMVYCEACAKENKGEQKEMPGWFAVLENELPVELPKVKDFRPQGKGESPLASVKDFYETTCPGCGGKARRETDVSDTFLDSAWYYLRYLDPKNEKEVFDKKIIKKWLPAEMYIGGAEHAVLHLLYVRFIAMVFHDLGLVEFDEPFKRFRAHGLLIKEGAKMSKSKGNVVNPDEYIKKFSADVLRMYLMFLAPFDQGGDFRDAGILGIERFLNRTWKLYESEGKKNKTSPAFHRAVKKVTEDIESLHYNTAISALMILLNEFEKEGIAPEEKVGFVKLLAPFAPHMAEEIWREVLGHKTSIHKEMWPEYDEKLIKEESFTLVIQINGKVRASVEVPIDISENRAKETALGNERVCALLDGKELKKVIYVPKKLINIVV